MPKPLPFSVSRVVNAPRALVYQVHVDSMHLAKWMSPEGFHFIHTAMDFRIDGSYHYGIEGPGGMRMWGRQVFHDIVPERRLVYIQSFSDERGRLTRHPMSPTWPLEMYATTEFADAGDGKTKVTITWQPYHTDEAGEATFDGARAGMDNGFEGILVNLEAYLAECQSARAP